MCYGRVVYFCICMLHLGFLPGGSLLAQVADSKEEVRFSYCQSPVDNPLRGLVPYVHDSASEEFPHSLEFSYLPLSQLMNGYDSFDWRPLEKLLQSAKQRGHQLVFRVWLEYPGREDGIPGFLENDGVSVTEWIYENTQPFPPKKIRTPDYRNPNLIRALEAFVHELGKKYDGDPRIACITAGLLGAWGEWHTFPRSDLMASKEVQRRVMGAYTKAFNTTKILLRYPAGLNDYAYAENHDLPLGYHDDSFAWATLHTGNRDEDWYFVTKLMNAGKQALNKWQSEMIGGEIRPELWGRIFDDDVGVDGAQNFDECVRKTHVSWLMDSGMFSNQGSPRRIENARSAVAKMGYEFHVSRARRNGRELFVTVRNTGVAPFYYDWPVQLGLLDQESNEIMNSRIIQDWKIIGLLPGRTRTWRTDVGNEEIGFAIRIPNPMDGGKPIRFANERSRQLPGGWLRLN